MEPSAPSCPAPVPETLSRRRGLLLLAGALLLFAATRVWLIGHLGVLAPDGVSYAYMARLWADSPSEAIDRNILHPGFPALMAWAHGLLSLWDVSEGPDRWVLAGQCIAAIAGLCALAGIYVFTVQAFDRRAAILAVLLLGMGRKFGLLTADVLTDAPALCLEVWAVVASVWVSRRLNGRWAHATLVSAAAGALLGGAYLIRPEGALVIAAILALWVIAAVRKRGRVAVVAACGAAMLVAFSVCAGPYMIAIGGFTHKWAVEQFVPISAVVAGTPACLAAAVNHSVAAAAYLAAAGLVQQMHTAAGGLAGVWMIAFFLRRYIPARMRLVPTWDTACVTAAWAILFMPVVIVRNLGAPTSGRYMLLLAALLMPVAAAGAMILVELAVHIARRIGITWPPLRTVYLCVAAGAIIVGLGVHCLRAIRPEKASRRLAGVNLAHRLPGNSVVVSRHPETIFHTALRGVVLTNDALASRAALQDLLATNTPPGATVYVAATAEELSAINPEAPAWLAEMADGDPTTFAPCPEDIHVTVYTLKIPTPHD